MRDEDFSLQFWHKEIRCQLQSAQFVQLARLLILLILIGATNAWAYPHFVAYGYTSCSVCHFNPAGAGPLTDYGRALGANEFSAKGPWRTSMSDEEVAAQSSFFGGSSSGWIKPSLDLRGLALLENAAVDSEFRWINMSADLNLVVGRADKFFVSGTFGYIPADGSEENWISREHYLGWRINKQNGLYAGFLDVVFGTRISEHTAFNRGGGVLALGQNDQTHGLVYHRADHASELFVHGFAGNLYQERDLRQMGGSVVYEFEPQSKRRFGSSLMYTQGKFRKRGAWAVHARLGPEPGLGVLTEAGIAWNKLEGADSNLAFYTTNHAFWRLLRGLHVQLSFEYLTQKSLNQRSHQFQSGPAIIYSPMQRFEFRAEILGIRTYRGTEGASTPDNLNVLGQVHVYL